MSYNTETTKVTAQYINSNFVRKIEDGREKEAQVEGSAFIREKLREESFAREILPPVLLADDEIDRDENTDQPKKIVEKEPNSIATFVNFQGTGPRTWFKGPRYAIYFGKVESAHFTKTKFELMTYQNDIRKILSDNAVKDMADEEDRKFMQLVDTIIAGNPAQQLIAATAFNSTPFKQAFRSLVNRRRPIGKILMTKGRYYDALDLPATSVGDVVASKHYTDGIEEEERLWGIPVISTIKAEDAEGNQLLNPNRAYVFSPENYLGNFFMLQDATLYIKQEAEIITFWSYEALGVGIGNTLSMQAIEFPA